MNYEDNKYILQKFLYFTQVYRGDIKKYQHLIEAFTTKLSMRIDFITMHTGQQSEAANSDIFIDIIRKDANKEGESQKLEKILSGYCNDTMDTPKGLIICLLNNKNMVQHMFSYVFGKNKKNEKVLVCADGLKEQYQFASDTFLYSPQEKTKYEESKVQKQLVGKSMLGWLLCSNSLEEIKYTQGMQLLNAFEIVHKEGEILKNFNELVLDLNMDQHNDICFFLALIFCVELLKENGKEFKTMVETKKLPQSIEQYRQKCFTDRLFDKVCDKYGEDAYDNFWHLLEEQKNKVIKDELVGVLKDVGIQGEDVKSNEQQNIEDNGRILSFYREANLHLMEEKDKNIADIARYVKEEVFDKLKLNEIDELLKVDYKEERNILAMKKFFKIFKDVFPEENQKIDDFIELRDDIISGRLSLAKQAKYQQYDMKEFIDVLKYYQDSNIVERKSWWDKALSFGENNAKKRRINQLAKIMNNEFTRNMTPEEKREFKKTDKKIRKMKEITFNDLLNISNIHKRCNCTGMPAVIE